MLEETREIRAIYNNSTIRVYQAYNSAIAESALSSGTFQTSSFNMNRMSWIKPSFFWMMYRSGWAKKDVNQERILAIDISIDGFLWCLENACLSSNKYGTFSSQEAFQLELQKCSVRVQWDPERDFFLEPLQNKKAIQIGLSKEALRYYVNEWIQSIEDITDFCHELHLLVQEEKYTEIEKRIPQEKLLSLPNTMRSRLAVTDA